MNSTLLRACSAIGGLGLAFLGAAHGQDTPDASAVAVPPPEGGGIVDNTSLVTVLCYHRFEDRPRDGLAISPQEFEAQMQKLKDEGIEVISMEDFLAWRRGEKRIPPRSAVITIDDGYLSGYTVAWPILKKFGYPFTMYPYTDYVKGGPRSGGQSMTWEQLAEMRDGGVDIGSHSISHASLSTRRGRTPEVYEAWLREELATSKRMIEERLGITVKTFAYPYGNQNEIVRRIAAESGYEAAFTVRGEKIGQGGDPMGLGRYAIESTKPEIFAQAVRFPSSGILASSQVPADAAAQVDPVEGAPPAAEVPPAPQAAGPVSPPPGSTIAGPLPRITVDLSKFPGVDAASVVMRIGGIGEVPTAYNEGTQILSYEPVARIYAPEVTISLAGRAGGQRFEERWKYVTAPTAPALPEIAPKE